MKEWDCGCVTEMVGTRGKNGVMDVLLKWLERDEMMGLWICPQHGRKVIMCPRYGSRHVVHLFSARNTD